MHSCIQTDIQTDSLESVLILVIECVLSHIYNTYNKNACILKRLESGHKELWGCVGAMGVR
jgi:hypothetical protein